MRGLALAGLLAASSVEAFSPASGFATPAGLRLPKDKVLSFYPPACVKCGAAISHGNSGGRRKIPAQNQLPCWSFEFCPTTGLAPARLHAARTIPLLVPPDTPGPLPHILFSSLFLGPAAPVRPPALRVQVDMCGSLNEGRRSVSGWQGCRLRCR